ncbi:MAG TPA: MMPL family transporter [Conexibacter sp.]|nr:MMPL family transporter [Conexibacter sp.]
MKPNNFAARAGRWSARHRKAAVLGWIAFVFAAFALGNVIVGGQQTSDRDEGVGESGRAEQILYDAFPQRADETVLVASQRLGAGDPAFRAAVEDVVQRMERRPEVVEVNSPYASGNAGQIAADGNAALVTMELRGDEDEVDDVERVLATTAAAQRAHPDLRIEQFGDASAEQAISTMFEDDFKKAEFLSLPITLVILVVAFGAFVAAGIPLLLAISSVMATLGLIALGSHVIPIEESVGSVVLLIGLAVGVDYTLFYLRREREERAAGRSEAAALEAAAATSGRAVLISGLTVMIAMAGMLISGSRTFVGMATGAILVVGVSLIASLTVLPALLSKLGDRVERGRIPFLMRRRNTAGEGSAARAWGAVIDTVLRRPLVSLIVAGGLLLALCLPVLGMHTALPGTDSLPRSLPVMQTYDRIQEHFPGKEIAATVAVEGDAVSTPAGRAAIAELRRAALASGAVNEPITVDVAKNGRVAAIALPIDGDGADATSMRALETIRTELTPALRTALPGAEVAVAGMTAGTADFNTLMNARIGWVFAFVLILAFALLLVTFRSVVIAAKAIALNLLSVGAAYGVLVLVFQHGWGESLLDFRSTGAITSWLPLFLFVVLFGLSMDYHVFILSRVREAYDRGMSTNDAIRQGIKSTAGTVTSAAIIMVAVFGVFATLSAVEFKQMGVGLAAAILIDATIVRAVLLPAAMTLLGERNWYLPRWLEWLPRVSPERSAEPLGAPAGPQHEPEPARAF